MNSISKLISSSISKYVEYTSIIACILMAVGFNYSRALLSLSMALLLCCSLYPLGLKRRLQVVAKDGFAIASLAYFSAILCSGIWSSNITSWAESALNASAFLFMPFSMLIVPFHKPKLLISMVIGIALVMMSGILVSFYNMLLEWDKYIIWEVHIPSAPAMRTDYIRYSIGLSFSMMTYIFLLSKNVKYQLSSIHKWILYIAIALTAFYINIQIAKTGLIAFYGLLLMLALYLIITKSKLITKISIAVVCITGLFLITQTSAFESGVDTFKRELLIYQEKDESEYDKTNSFTPRLISFEIAFNIIQDHLFTGVGIGDVKKSMQEGYTEDYNVIKLKNRLVPHNQYIYTLMGIGCILGLTLPIMLVAGFKSRTHHSVKVYVISISTVTMVLCLVEAILVVQMTTYAYLFYLLFFRNIRRIPIQNLS